MVRAPRGTFGTRAYPRPPYRRLKRQLDSSRFPRLSHRGSPSMPDAWRVRPAYPGYRGAASEGRRVPFLTIDQGPTGGQAWQIHARECYFSQETVGVASTLFVRGGLVIRARIVDGVETIDSCGWDPNREGSLVFVTNGHAVRTADSPASDFPRSAQESCRIAQRLPGKSVTWRGAVDGTGIPYSGTLAPTSSGARSFNLLIGTAGTALSHHLTCVRKSGPSYAGLTNPAF